MKKRILVLSIALLLFAMGAGVVFASELCRTCGGLGTVCPFDSNDRITVPAPSGDGAHCERHNIDFDKFNCKPCKGTGRI
jgi:hypothetical protein